MNDHGLEAQLATLGVRIDEQTKDNLLWLAKELLRWNQKINLTAITTLGEVINKHLVDSLSILSLLTGDERLLDLGSGAGFPGLPLKISKASLSLVSVEAVAKKVFFQRHVVRHLNLSGCTILNLRAEEVSAWPEFHDGFDKVVARALSSLKDLISLGLPCLAPNGELIAMKGPEGEKELRDAKHFLEERNLICVDVRRLRLPGSGAERTLISLMKKQVGSY